MTTNWLTIIIFLKLVNCSKIPIVQNQRTPNDTIELCSNFTNNNLNEFYSPLYPKLYPSSIQCIKSLEAPPGHVLRLHFLENFNIEYEETCKYDYLEIRDGQFGYSSLIGKICGSIPPSYIESSGRYLWLRFTSDQDIQYIGFKIKFQFIPTTNIAPSSTATDSEEICGETFREIQGWIKSEEIPQETRENRLNLGVPLDCTWIIEAEQDQKIFLQFPKYALEKPNDCTYNFVEVYGSKTELEGDEGRIKQFCGSERDSLTSKSNKLHVRFFSGMSAVTIKSKFEAYFSVFRETKEGQKCIPNDEFDCTDGTCIAFSLRCNDHINCKFRNDEDEKCNSAKGKFKLTTDILIIAFLGILLMAGMCSGLMLNIYRKLKQDKMELSEIRESLRKSRESVKTAQSIPPHKSSSHKSSSGSPSSSELSKDTVVDNTKKVTIKPAEFYYSPPAPYNPQQTTSKAIGQNQNQELQVRDSACQTYFNKKNEKQGADILVTESSE